MIQIKRVYEPIETTDGCRVLVERLWPRGIKKGALHVSGWLKEVAPSAGLRRWFNHDPVKWPEFRRRYRAELAGKPDTWQQLLESAKDGHLSLLFSAHDLEHNNAVALKAFLDKRLTHPGKIRQ